MRVVAVGAVNLLAVLAVQLTTDSQLIENLPTNRSCSWSARYPALLTMMTYSVAPHMNPTAADALRKTQKHDNPSLQGKSVELAGSGVTSVFPTRLDHNVGNKRGPNWLAGFLYWLRRKERGMSKHAGRFTVMMYKSLQWLAWNGGSWRNLQTCSVDSKAHMPHDYSASTMIYPDTCTRC